MLRDILTSISNTKLLTIRKTYTRLYRHSLRQWLIHHHTNIVFEKMHWMGVRILKNPLDLWIYQEIIFKNKPDVIVEIGSANGGSTLYLAHICDVIGHGMVLSVDVCRDEYAITHPRVEVLTGDSLSEHIIRQIHAYCAGKSAMVIHDADHTYESVYKNLKTYHSIVTEGQYFIVEDGIIDLFSAKESIGGHKGPLPACMEFVAEHPEFEVDTACERYWLTYNPYGFLRKKTHASK